MALADVRTALSNVYAREWGREQNRAANLVRAGRRCRRASAHDVRETTQTLTAFLPSHAGRPQGHRLFRDRRDRAAHVQRGFRRVSHRALDLPPRPPPADPPRRRAATGRSGGRPRSPFRRALPLPFPSPSAISSDFFFVACVRACTCARRPGTSRREPGRARFGQSRPRAQCQSRRQLARFGTKPREETVKRGGRAKGAETTRISGKRWKKARRRKQRECAKEAINVWRTERQSSESGNPAVRGNLKQKDARLQRVLARR